MSGKRKFLLTITVFCVACSMVLVPTGGTISVAKTVDEIQAEIDAQNAKLAELQKQLDAAQNNVNNLQSQIGSAQGTIPQLQAQIDQIEANIQYNNLQLQKLSQQESIKELEAERREKQQDRALKNAYVNWRSDSKFSSYLLNEERTNPLKKDVYQSAVMNKEKLSIDELDQQINDIKVEVTKFKQQTGDLEKQNSDLQAHKAELEAQVAALRNSLNGSQGQVAGLKSQTTILQAKLSQLSAEQKALQEYTLFILSQSPNGGSANVPQGQYYIQGVGNSDQDYGHGVGMSQYGAKGAAQAGMSAAQILAAYYPGTHLEARPSRIDVQGYGNMDINDYAAGQAEIARKACGTQQQIDDWKNYADAQGWGAGDARRNKYVLDNPGTEWDCWPEESIKAMVIAYRSYGISYERMYGTAICADAYCQAYEGGNNSYWASYETWDQVIVSDGPTQPGQVIEAYYSADNSNGWGSADNDTIWSGRDGSGTPYSYLRARPDPAGAYHVNNYGWGWRTNGYTLNPVQKSDGTYTTNDFRDMLEATTHNQRLSQQSRDFVADIYNSVGEIASVNLVPDASARVKLVKFVGTNGVVKQMSGWYFQTIWTYWVQDRMPTGQVDPIYSLTFILRQQ